MAKDTDLELAQSVSHDAHLYNDSVDSISWSGINVHLPDKATKSQKYLVLGLSGDVKAGECAALIRSATYGCTMY
jgi:hypothetical protein